MFASISTQARPMSTSTTSLRPLRMRVTSSRLIVW
jgi:hypothetical protein